MEPAQIQLVFNVIGITGVTSLGSFCYLLRKENRELAAQRKPERNQVEEQDSEAAVLQSIVIRTCQESFAPKGTFRASRTISPTGQDIRHFAAGRRKRWVKGLTSAISHDGGC
jgi:hypothetical protein